MPIEITMPRLSDTMEEGTLVKWHVKVGDKVSTGDVLADVETDKATMELQSYDDGIVARLELAEGQAAAVGKPILVLAQEGETVEEAGHAKDNKETGTGDRLAAERKEATADRMQATGQKEAAASSVQRPVSGPKASPLARKIAEQKGVELATVRGTGPGGRIIKRDVLGAEAKPGAQAATVSVGAVAQLKLEDRTIALTSARKTIARRLSQSKATIPHFTVTVTVDADPLISTRSALNEHLQTQGVKLAVDAFIVRAVALAIRRHPLVNASWSEEGIVMHGAVNVGVAVAIPQERGGGLVVPVVRDALHKTVRQISDEVVALAEKARTRGLTLEEMSEGTFTISNLGMYGLDHFEAIINPPQAAILAIGAAQLRPMVRTQQVTVGREMSLTLSADHRLIDGALAAEFLMTLKQQLEQPVLLLA